MAVYKVIENVYKQNLRENYTNKSDNAIFEVLLSCLSFDLISMLQTQTIVCKEKK